MLEEYQICPYTGLRSFTEEESLYFKGREEHIQQATEQLQRQKFLMLTGASGDGKSSLVYAGIIPNARAGFLKSKFSHWCVADFRPERTPFRNLAHAVARQLEIANPATVESELQHGFSALADLYKNSSRYVDTESLEWANADEQSRSVLKRQAANLIILVDQFEEFFTNPENYHRGVPSRDSNLVLNVLLETARIALEQDLPIYVVFTMRSDYIGQCAAFRSLPEYIGFSQFFVPRLNRTQLQQVIEEPATLSGNRITRRLTERLIHDIAEGVDQLPILQHALNQIWHAASNGKEEMDLIHYAMVGGMAAAELPDEQVDRYKKWFNALPDNIKPFYQDPNLQNVLDTHANKLLESSSERYRTRTGNSLPEETVKRIIRTAFTCLTKIDQSRAVRNRMTLEEITNVLNRPDVDTKTVGHVLNIFREPGNTFIRPFVTDDPHSASLRDTDVMDITHESLIRNWEYLETWAKEEFDNYTISLDFEKQLDRWVESGKSGGFLLSIGPLTYFEDWYMRVNPNAWWIARYLPEDVEQNKKLEKAKVVLDNTGEFIKRSARKHLVTRTIMRYGPKRMAAVLGLVGLLTLSSFVASNYFKRQNAFILKSIKEQAFQLANSPKVNFYDKPILLLELIKSGSATIEESIGHVDDSLYKIYVASRISGTLILQGRGQPRAEIIQILETAEKHIRALHFKKASSSQLTSLVKDVNYLMNAAELACIYDPSKEILELRSRIAEDLHLLVMHILKEQRSDFTEVNHLNHALENVINNRAIPESDVQWIIQTMSPFEAKNRSAWVLKNYATDKLAERGDNNYGLKSNGLYQELAYLYGSMGDSGKALQCIDTLLTYSQSYFANDYTFLIDNATNIAMVFYDYGHKQALDAFVKGYCEKKKMGETEFYQRLIGRSHVSFSMPSGLNEFGGVGLRNLNCQRSDEKTLVYWSDRYRASILGAHLDPDEENYLMARAYKDEAALRFHLLKQRGKREELERLFPLVDTAFQYFNKIKPNYLQGEIMAAITSNNDAKMVPRKNIFLYPDYRPTFSCFEPRSIVGYYTSEFFLEYLMKRGTLNKYYKDDDLQLITNWLEANLRETTFFANGSDRMRTMPHNQTLISLEAALASRNASAYMDLNLLYLNLGDSAARNDDAEGSLKYYGKVKVEKLGNLLRSPEFVVRINTFYKVAYMVTSLCANGKLPEAYSVVEGFKNHVNRSSLYAFAARTLMERRINSPLIQQLLDSSRVEMGRIEDLSLGQPNRQLVAHALAMQDPANNTAEAYAVVKNIGNKFDPTLRISRSFAFHGNLYGAQQQILDNASDNDQANFMWNILYGYSQGKQDLEAQWTNYTSNILGFRRTFLPYVIEDN